MTKEQEEAIGYVQKQIDYFEEQIKFIEAVDRTYYEAEYKLYKNRVKQFETVLNMLKEQREENKKKDKQIDLMTEFIEKVTVDLKVAFGENMLWNRDEIKQYFERKAKDGRN